MWKKYVLYMNNLYLQQQYGKNYWCKKHLLYWNLKAPVVRLKIDLMLKSARCEGGWVNTYSNSNHVIDDTILHVRYHTMETSCFF